MVIIKQFKPTDARSSNDLSSIRDPISFLVKELGPFDPHLLRQGRRVSQMPNSNSWTRLSYSKGEEQASKGGAIYIWYATGSQLAPPDTVTDSSQVSVATTSAIREELDRVGAVVNTKLAQLSSLSLLEVDSTQSPWFAIKQLRNATKGEVVDNLKLSQNSTYPFLFLLHNYNATPNYTKGYKIIDGDTLEVDSLAPFQNPYGMMASYVTLLAVGAKDITTELKMMPGASSGIVHPFSSNSLLSRKLLLFKLVELIPATTNSKPKIRLSATDFSPATATPTRQNSQYTIFNDKLNENVVVSSPNPYLFSFAEIADINSCLTGSFVIIPGYPVLSRAFLQKEKKTSAHSSAPLLDDFAALIKAEIPKTNLYIPTVAGDNTQAGTIRSGGLYAAETARFVGNLDRESLRVTIADNDTTSILVDKGEGQLGAAVDYKLHTQPDIANDIESGDVTVTIRLEAFPALIPILGQATMGAEGIQVATDLKAFAELKNIKGTLVEALASQATSTSEYFFNRGLPGRNSGVYGAIRTFDKINFIQQDRSGNRLKLGTATIARIDPINNIVFFTEPLKFDLLANSGTANYFMEVPQSPLNPGRTYRVNVSCSDRIAAANEGTPIYPSMIGDTNE